MAKKSTKQKIAMGGKPSKKAAPKMGMKPGMKKMSPKMAAMMKSKKLASGAEKMFGSKKKNYS